MSSILEVQERPADVAVINQEEEELETERISDQAIMLRRSSSEIMMGMIRRIMCTGSR